jgi:hypothetical protein
MGWDMVITHMSYGPRFIRHRQFIQEYFKAPSVREFHVSAYCYPDLMSPEIICFIQSMMEQEAHTFVCGLAENPAALLKHIQRFTDSRRIHPFIVTYMYAPNLNRFTASTILRVTYSHEVQTTDDEYIQASVL